MVSAEPGAVVSHSGNWHLDAAVAAVVTIAPMDHPLRRYREERGLSQTEMAALLGTTKVTISRWENERRRIPAERVLDLERQTGVPRHDLRPDLYPRAAAEAAA